MTSILELLTPEQKQQLLSELLGSTQATAVAESPAPKVPEANFGNPPEAKPVAKTPPKRTNKTPKLDLSDALAVQFRAVLSPNERCRDQSWAQTYDTVSVKGHYQVKGPKGGMYCLGQAVLSNDDGDLHACTFKISNKNFLQLKNGGEIDGWCVDNDTGESLFIGTLSQYHATK